MQDHIKKEVMTHVFLLQQRFPQQSGDRLPLLASCLEQLMVRCEENHKEQEKNIKYNFMISIAVGIAMA